MYSKIWENQPLNVLMLTGAGAHTAAESVSAGLSSIGTILKTPVELK